MSKAPKRFVSQAPKPVRGVGGGTHVWRNNQPVNIPSDLWPYCPALEAVTQRILAEAACQLEMRAQLPELLKRLVGKLTPHLVRAIKGRILPADMALSEGFGVLRVVHSLLISNQWHGDRAAAVAEVKRSREWLALVSAVAALPGTGRGLSGNSVSGNIERLRIECGWSLNQLSDRTGINARLVKCHLSGRYNPNLATLKLYADAFAREPKRHVTVNELKV